MDANVSPEGLTFQPFLTTEPSDLQLLTLESTYTPRIEDPQTIVTTWDGLPTARTQIWSPDEKASLIIPNAGFSGGNEKSKYYKNINHFMKDKPEPVTPPTVEMTPEERVQINWQRARKVCSKIRFEYRFRNLLNLRDFNILQGESLQDIPIKDRRSRFMTWSINPQSNSLFAWKLLVHCGIILFTLIHTYRLAFGSPLYDEDSLDILTQTMELSFFLNILVKFFTGVRKENDYIMSDRYGVAIHYVLHNSFIIDIIALLPFDVLIRNLGLLKLLRLIHLYNLHLSLRFAFNNIFAFFKFKSLKALNLSRFCGNILAVIIYIVIFCHIWACIWIVLGFPRYPGEATWFIDVEHLDFEFESDKLRHGMAYLYLRSLYYVVGTLTTNGFGDPIGHTIREYLVSMTLMFFGLLLFTVFYEKAKDIINDKTKGLYSAKVEELDEWFHKIKTCVDDNMTIVDSFLLAAVQKTLEHRIEHNFQHLFVNNEQYKHLDPTSRKQILNVVFQNLRNKFDILFRNLSEDFINYLLMFCEPRVYIANEVIILRGTDTKGLYLIREGIVAQAGKVPDMMFNRLIAGSFFGESFLTSNPTSSYYYIAENKVSCLFIEEKVFEEAIVKFSKDIKAIQLLAYIRETHFSNELANYEKQKVEISPKKGRDSSFKPLRFIDSTPAHRNILRANQNHGGETPLLKRVLESTPTTGRFKNFTDYQNYVESNLSSNFTESEMLFSPAISRKKKNKIVPIKFLKDDDSRPSSPSTPTKEPEKEGDESPDRKSSPRARSMVRKSTAIIIKEQEGLQHHRKEEENNEDDGRDSDDELNQSDIFPLEIDLQKFSDIKELEDIEEYLEERQSFLLEKFKRIEKKMMQEIGAVLGKSKMINKKLTRLFPKEVQQDLKDLGIAL